MERSVIHMDMIAPFLFLSHIHRHMGPLVSLPHILPPPLSLLSSSSSVTVGSGVRLGRPRARLTIVQQWRGGPPARLPVVAHLHASPAVAPEPACPLAGNGATASSSCGVTAARTRSSDSSSTSPTRQHPACSPDGNLVAHSRACQPWRDRLLVWWHHSSVHALG
jgi:hypothetical protein